MRFKKIIMVTASFLVVIALSVGSTMAYFSYITNEVKNTFSFGNVEVRLSETFDSSKASGIVPLVEVEKRPIVTIDENSQPCWVRLKVTVSGIEESNLNIDYNLGDDANKWKKSYDGYYYYNTKLENVAGKTATTPLFTRVIVNDNVTEGTENGFDISITAEALQADGITDITAAWQSIKMPK